MGTRAPSVDGPDVGGAAFARVNGSDEDEDDGPSPGIMGMGKTMLCAAASEGIGKACTPSDVPGVS